MSDKTVFSLDKLYIKKFPIEPSHRIGSAGSCFAQHVSANLKKRGYHVVDVEPAPDFMSREEAREHGYGIYSARYGNIYSVRQLLQLINDAKSGTIRDDDFIEHKGRFIDLLRPNTQPGGYDSLEEARFSRAEHLEKVKELFSGIDLFVFTLGLTEAWVNSHTGTVYPVCPDTLTDTTSGKYRFHNFDYSEILDDLKAVRETLKAFTPDLRFVFTVSPVPLTATASNHHVLVSTTYSKSVLRAVCGAMEGGFDDVDYFPSYEVITSSLSRGIFYESNLRNVNQVGVNTAMAIFFSEHASEAGTQDPRQGRGDGAASEDANDDVVCEEILLDAFSR
ncbi:GSCFA domain-containing protein [Aestuariivirga sp.]|uniref:GSCFA domain-containing protein n=1 Tax=Aestuariivirga sp. TaxID=2650926 RepID=UPI00359329B3